MLALAPHDMLDLESGSAFTDVCLAEDAETTGEVGIAPAAVHWSRGSPAHRSVGHGAGASVLLA